MNALKTVVRQMRILSLWTALLLPPLGAEMLKVAQRHSVYRVIPQYSFFVMWHLTWNSLNGLFGNSDLTLLLGKLILFGSKTVNSSTDLSDVKKDDE